jgi:hypothetical protein
MTCSELGIVITTIARKHPPLVRAFSCHLASYIHKIVQVGCHFLILENSRSSLGGRVLPA